MVWKRPGETLYWKAMASKRLAWGGVALLQICAGGPRSDTFVATNSSLGAAGARARVS